MERPWSAATPLGLDVMWGKDSDRRPSGTNRVNPGGSWNNNSINCRVANRNNIGFRLARSSDQGGRSAPPCAWD
jgi:hypothetical protein